MSAHWYCLHVKRHKEQSTYKRLQSRQLGAAKSALDSSQEPFDVFFPAQQVEPVNPRSSRIRAFFPGYMFVLVDLDAVGKHAFSWLPGAYGLVSLGDQPAIVPQSLIDSLQTKMAELETFRIDADHGFHAGDQVRITDGPFAGYEAIFDTRLTGNERVQVLLNFLNSPPMKLKIDSKDLEKVDDK